MNACIESQYDNLVNSIFQKNDASKAVKKCKMINLIGDDYKKINSLEKNINVTITLKEIRESRKWDIIYYFE